MPESKPTSYEAIAEYWDHHELSDRLILHAKGLDIMPTARRPAHHPKSFHRDVVVLPEVVVEEDPSDVTTALPPIFDSIWQAAGHYGSLSYDENGNVRQTEVKAGVRQQVASCNSRGNVNHTTPVILDTDRNFDVAVFELREVALWPFDQLYAGTLQ